MVFEVMSFSFFLFSYLIAQGLKLAINLINSKDVKEAFRAHVNLKALLFRMLGLDVGSVLGCLFLMLSMVNVIEIRLGMLSCGSRSTMNTVVAMVVLVSSALLVYISTAVYAFSPLKWILQVHLQLYCIQFCGECVYIGVKLYFYGILFSSTYNMYIFIK